MCIRLPTLQQLHCYVCGFIICIRLPALQQLHCYVFMRGHIYNSDCVSLCMSVLFPFSLRNYSVVQCRENSLYGWYLIFTFYLLTTLLSVGFGGEASGRYICLLLLNLELFFGLFVGCLGYNMWLQSVQEHQNIGLKH